MAITVGGTTITFNDSTTQTTAAYGMRFALFTSNGTFVVPAGVTNCNVIVIGGGSGAIAFSDGYGTGYRNGYPGGYAERYISDLTPGSSISVTVGNGGAALSTSNSNAYTGSGGSSSFGAFASATGGSGYSWNTYGSLNSAMGSGGDFNSTCFYSFPSYGTGGRGVSGSLNAGRPGVVIVTY